MKSYKRLLYLHFAFVIVAFSAAADQIEVPFKNARCDTTNIGWPGTVNRQELLFSEDCETIFLPPTDGYYKIVNITRSNFSSLCPIINQLFSWEQNNDNFRLNALEKLLTQLQQEANALSENWSHYQREFPSAPDALHNFLGAQAKVNDNLQSGFSNLAHCHAQPSLMDPNCINEVMVLEQSKQHWRKEQERDKYETSEHAQAQIFNRFNNNTLHIQQQLKTTLTSLESLYGLRALLKSYYELSHLPTLRLTIQFWIPWSSRIHDFEKANDKKGLLFKKAPFHQMTFSAVVDKHPLEFLIDDQESFIAELDFPLADSCLLFPHGFDEKYWREATKKIKHIGLQPRANGFFLALSRRCYDVKVKENRLLETCRSGISKEEWIQISWDSPRCKNSNFPSVSIKSHVLTEWKNSLKSEFCSSKPVNIRDANTEWLPFAQVDEEFIAEEMRYITFHPQ